MPWLSHSAVAYVNVDVATSGTQFTASSAPLLDDLIYKATASTKSPNTTLDQSVSDLWNRKIRTMGSGSDFTAFQDFAGIPCMQIGFEPADEAGAPIYHYHSNYDSFHWMDSMGDKGWNYHRTVAAIWGLITSELIERPLLPFNATNYAHALGTYLAKVEEKAKSAKLLDSASSVSFEKLDKAIQSLQKAASKLDDRAASLQHQLDVADGFAWYQASEKLARWTQAQEINSQYKYLERAFLYQNGFDGRPWFKHTVFAPGRWTGYSGATFPPLIEAIEDLNIGRLQKWQNIIEEQVYAAALSIA